jgi:hypothetical protein
MRISIQPADESVSLDGFAEQALCMLRYAGLSQLNFAAHWMVVRRS